MANDFGGLSALESARQGIANKLKIENAARIAGGRTAGTYGGATVGGIASGILGKLMAAKLKLKMPGQLRAAGASGLIGGAAGAGLGRTAGGVAAGLHNTAIPDFMNQPVEPDTIASVSNFINKQASDIAAILGDAYTRKQADGNIDIQGVLQRVAEAVANHPVASGAVAGGGAGFLSGDGIMDRIRRAAGGAAIGGAMGYGGRLAYDQLKGGRPAATAKSTHAYPGGVIDNSKLNDALNSESFQKYKTDPGPGLISKGIRGGARLGANAAVEAGSELYGTTTGAAVGALNAGLSPKVDTAALANPRNLSRGLAEGVGAKDKVTSGAANYVNDLSPADRLNVANRLAAQAKGPTNDGSLKFPTSGKGTVMDRIKAVANKTVVPVANKAIGVGRRAAVGAQQATGKETMPIDMFDLKKTKTTAGPTTTPIYREGLNEVSSLGAAANAAKTIGKGAEKVTKAAPQAYRGLFTGRVGTGSRLGRFAVPTIAGGLVDLGRYLTTPDTTPQQTQRLGELQKIVGK